MFPMLLLQVIINTETRSVEVNKKGVYFAFRDQGACLSLLAIKVNILWACSDLSKAEVLVFVISLVSSQQLSQCSLVCSIVNVSMCIFRCTTRPARKSPRALPPTPRPPQGRRRVASTRSTGRVSRTPSLWRRARSPSAKAMAPGSARKGGASVWLAIR